MYTKMVISGNQVEIYNYENRPIQRTKPKRTIQQHEGNNMLTYLAQNGENAKTPRQQKQIRSQRSARRATLAFRRLVRANLIQPQNAILASLTYADKTATIENARKDWQSFTRNLRTLFGPQIRHICVTEFQLRGAVHLHALIWGIPNSVVASERDTRLVASLWGRGFVDLRFTDNSAKLATYLSKYMAKSFLDERLAAVRAYTTSYNVYRPEVSIDPLLTPYFSGYARPDLSTVPVAQQGSYDTVWLGRCNYRKYITE